MKTKTIWAAMVFLLMVLAIQPSNAEARDNISVAADLGGLLVHYDNYPRRAWVPPPPPPPVYWDGGRRTIVEYDYPPPPPPRHWHRRHHHDRDYWDRRWHHRHHRDYRGW